MGRDPIVTKKQMGILQKDIGVEFAAAGALEKKKDEGERKGGDGEAPKKAEIDVRCGGGADRIC